MRIDAHQHFWRLGRGDYGWLTPNLAAIHRDFAPDDLRPLLGRHGVDRTILIQAAPTLAETHYLLDLAVRTPFVTGVVGWADFSSTDAPGMIAALARDPLLVGLRPMVQDIADDDWLLRPNLAPAFHALVAHGLVLDALVLPRHLPRLLVLADRHPNLVVVIDHGAKPPIQEGRHSSWAADMAALAARAQIWCKLSGLVTEAGPDWTARDLAPYVAHLVALFGPNRLLWGSDWPVVNLAGGYCAWIDACDALLAALSDADRAMIRGGAAARLYLTRRGRAC